SVRRSDLRREAIARLGPDTALPPAQLADRLLGAVLGIDRTELLLRPDAPVLPQDALTFRAAAERVAFGEPLTRVIGQTEFYGRPFKVTPDVLDPRPETEGIVDLVLAFVGTAGRAQPWRICDVGTGSGCLAVTLLAELPNATAVAIDISASALEVAQENARAIGVAGRLNVKCADLRDGLGGPFDILVSNPPYIRSGDIDGLETSVRNHDPHLALDGGGDGLTFYRALSGQLSDAVPDGFAVFEVGHDQAAAVVDMVNGALTGCAPRDVRSEPDLSGIARYVAVRTRYGGAPKKELEPAVDPTIM
ncbi:MAG: peptide chain release factor N(5)-glutamine methyltransferase, partial [Pseudomonadota bacterium]